jgi:hypothetical protein
VLSTAYVGGLYFFTRVVRETRWHRVQVGFLRVATFSSLLGVATVLHWDRFSHGYVSFWTWAALYFAAPFLVLAVWWANRRRDPRTRCDRSASILRRWHDGVSRGACAALG